MKKFLAVCFALIIVSVILVKTSDGASSNKLQILRCSTHQTAKRQLHCGKVNLYHGSTTLVFLRKHRSAGTTLSRKSLRKSARYLVYYGYKHIQQASGRMLPAHFNGWVCIHEGEGAWDANTRNGYYGGLQAHYDWYGVKRMDKLTPLAQIQHAENVYRQTGYSHAWLAGQWPNTYPPCASYF